MNKTDKLYLSNLHRLLLNSCEQVERAFNMAQSTEDSETADKLIAVMELLDELFFEFDHKRARPEEAHTKSLLKNQSLEN